MASAIRRVCIVGTGAWGTVLGTMIAARCGQTTLLARTPAEAALLACEHENRRFLPGVRLPEALIVSSNPAPALAAAELVVLAVPAQRLRENLLRLAPMLPAGAVLLCASKGIELDTGLRMSQVVADVLALREGGSLTLSGPNLSGEIAQGLPAAAVVAGPAPLDRAARRVQTLLASGRFRVYTSTDQPGVEIGGAMKNVIAIACGVCDGLGYGHNARAGLITRGLAEVTRLARAAGGRPRTLAGLAGLGDLVATVASASSRNYALGVALGRGERLDDLATASVHVAEGVPTTRAALTLAARFGIALPITAQLDALLSGACSPQEGARALMRRALGAE